MLSEKLVMQVVNEVLPERSRDDNIILARTIVTKHYQEMYKDKRKPSPIKFMAAEKIIAEHLVKLKDVLVITYEDERYVATLSGQRAVNLSTYHPIMDLLVLLALGVVET